MIGGEIIGADAFQIYSGLPILTAQPAPELLRRIPHHLIGILGLQETCNAARFAELARRCIHEIQSRGKVPILTGGTGLYLKALTHGLADLPPADPGLREKISLMVPAEALARLAGADADAPGQIDARNPRCGCAARWRSFFRPENHSRHRGRTGSRKATGSADSSSSATAKNCGKRSKKMSARCLTREWSRR